MTPPWVQTLLARAEPGPPKWASPAAMATALAMPMSDTTPALRVIDQALVDVATDPSQRLAIFMSPQEGKSRSASHKMPLWLLANHPGLRIALVSYDDTRAQRWGRAIRRDLRSYPQLGVTLASDSTSVGRFETSAGGMVICVGINSGLTGEPVDVVILDDPVKGRREAESATIRESTWDVWENTIVPRLGPGAIVILMMTRWHTDDLAGRVLDREPGLWRVVSIPAIAEDPDDPLGREPGEEMQSVRGRPAGYFHALADRMSPYVFRSVYQQRPTSAQGTMFLRDKWRYWTQLPGGKLDLAGSMLDVRDAWRVITCDLAGSTRTSADYTVAAVWALTQDGQVVLLDRVRERTAEADHWGLVRPLAERWQAPDVGVESTMMGTTLVRAAAAAGLRPFDLHADRDKITRAVPYSHLQRTGRVWLPVDAPWLDEWIGEHADFPNTAHDDQVDTGSYAARLAVAEWNPGGDPTPPIGSAPPEDRWDTGGDVNLATVPF